MREKISAQSTADDSSMVWRVFRRKGGGERVFGRFTARFPVAQVNWSVNWSPRVTIRVLLW
jgi:hypothetical protein